jgi:hypothetical protein
MQLLSQFSNNQGVSSEPQFSKSVNLGQPLPRVDLLVLSWRARPVSGKKHWPDKKCTAMPSQATVHPSDMP